MKEDTTIKTITQTNRLSDLGAFLRGTGADETIARTTYIAAVWREAEFVAHRAGFQISRFLNEDYVRNHTFAECYRLTRR